MDTFTTVLIVALIVLAILAVKFLVGMAKTIVSVAVFILIAGLIISLLTGYDLLGIGSTAAAVAETVNETVQNVTALS